MYALFALNMSLQERRIGPWRQYVFGEYCHIVLNLAPKSPLAR